MTYEQIETSNHHISHLANSHRHWHSESEMYTGADALITALQQGWKIVDDVTVDEHYFAGNRSINTYDIVLQRHSDTVTMRVIHNPYLNRMLHQKSLTIKQ